jgi:hypothetical protein
MVSPAVFVSVIAYRTCYGLRLSGGAISHRNSSCESDAIRWAYTDLTSESSPADRLEPWKVVSAPGKGKDWATYIDLQRRGIARARHLGITELQSALKGAKGSRPGQKGALFSARSLPRLQSCWWT